MRVFKYWRLLFIGSVSKLLLSVTVLRHILQSWFCFFFSLAHLAGSISIYFPFRTNLPTRLHNKRRTSESSEWSTSPWHSSDSLEMSPDAAELSKFSRLFDFYWDFWHAPRPSVSVKFRARRATRKPGMICLMLSLIGKMIDWLCHSVPRSKGADFCIRSKWHWAPADAAGGEKRPNDCTTTAIKCVDLLIYLFLPRKMEISRQKSQ